MLLLKRDERSVNLFNVWGEQSDDDIYSTIKKLTRQGILKNTTPLVFHFGTNFEIDCA